MKVDSNDQAAEIVLLGCKITFDPIDEVVLILVSVVKVLQVVVYLVEESWWLAVQ